MTLSSSLWAAASESEKRCTIEAFASNTSIQAVEMSSSMINDTLAQAWAKVLPHLSALTSLNLESNSISTR